MGYKFSNKGTIYLIEVIEVAYNSKNYLNLLSNLNKNIYPKISEKYNINLKTLESNITKATNNMNKFRQTYYTTPIKEKINTKAVIWIILDRLKNNSK